MASERRMRTLYLIALLAILLAATFLRFYRLDASSLWSDEGNTWAMLSRSYSEIAGAAAADIHPPGYYWLLKLWSSIFGTSAWAMRSFSAAAGVLLVLVVERIGRLAGCRSARRRFWLPLLAALMAAVNPLLVYYSQEARMYMLLALAGAGLFWAMLAGEIWDFQEVALPGGTHLQEVPTSWKSFLRGGWLAGAGYVLFAVLGLWTHYSFAIVLAAANVAWLVRWLVVRFQRSAHVRPWPGSCTCFMACVGGVGRSQPDCVTGVFALAADGNCERDHLAQGWRSGWLVGRHGRHPAHLAVWTRAGDAGAALAGGGRAVAAHWGGRPVRRTQPDLADAVVGII